MKKLAAYTLILIVFFNLAPAPLYAAENPIFNPEALSRAEIKKLLLSELIYRYSFYNLFLKETHIEKGFIISDHGENNSEILKYLEQGFCAELAWQIINYATAYQPEIKKQVIIPREGLPMITEEDLPFIRWEIKEKEIIFIRTYQIDCPDFMQTICYKIHARFNSDGFEIYKLELEERETKKENPK